MRIIKYFLVLVALLPLAGCTTLDVPTPWGVAHYRQCVQKKSLVTRYDPKTGEFTFEYNTAVDPTVLAITQAFQAGMTAAAK